MDFTNYKGKIQKLVNHIRKCRCEGDLAYMEDCRELISIGEKTSDAYLLGYGYYYLAEGYYCQNDCENFLENLTKSTVYQRESSQWKLLVRSYNMLGIHAATRGNTTVAVDQYIMALNYGEKYGCSYEVGLVYTNIAGQYLNVRAYDAAVCYLKKAEKVFVECCEDSFARVSLAVVYTILGKCSLFLGNLRHAEAYEKKIQEMQVLNKGNVEELVFQCLCARIRHAQVREKERDAYIARIRENLDMSQTFLNCEEEIFDFVDFLLEIGKYQELEALFPRLEQAAQKAGITYLKIKLLRRQARYFKLMGNRMEYLECCAKLYEYEEQLEEENVSMTRRSTELRFQLEEARYKEEKLEKEKKLLKERSEKDALTGLPNRYRLNDVAERMFEYAFENQRSLAVEIFDVDYFKQYNDTYGHQEGDSCLKQIGRILRGWMRRDSNIFCARYGGDEFVIIWYGKKDEELLALAQELREQVLELKMEHSGSRVSEYVTVSQGICNSVPRHRNRVWDYLHSADGALYEVKQQQKGGICLVHRTAREIKESVML